MATGVASIGLMSGGATDPDRSVQNQDLQVVKDATELTSQTLSTGEVDFSEETAVAMRDLGLSEEDALRHVQEQFERAQFREQLYAEHADCIGGFNYEIDSHRMTVSTASDECRTDIVSASQEMPFDVDLIDANYSLDELEQYATLINNDTEVANIVAADVNFEDGAVVLYSEGQNVSESVQTLSAVTYSNDMDDISDELPPDLPIQIVPDPSIDLVEDVCTSSSACGRPLRSGVTVSLPDGRISSAGFTATAADGSRWLITTFHENGGKNASIVGQTVRHGEQYIGKVRESHNIRPTGVDWTRVRISNPYWLGGSRGWLSGPTRNFADGSRSSVLLNNNPVGVYYYTAGSVGVARGDVVCLHARRTRSGDMCGTVGGYPGGVLGPQVKVNNYEACRGDSGGGWVYKNPQGYRVAVGIHHASAEPSCPVLTGGSANSGTGYSVFTKISAIHLYMDATAGQNFRIDTRQVP